MWQLQYKKVTSVFQKSDYSDLFGTVPGNHSAWIKTYKNNIWFCCSFAYCATFFLVETWCLVLAKPGKPLAMSQVVERYPPLVLRQDEQEKVSTCTDMQQTCKMSSMFVGFCSNKNLQVEHLDQRMTKDMVQICPNPKQASVWRRHYGITVIVINMWINMWCYVLFNIIHWYSHTVDAVAELVQGCGPRSAWPDAAGSAMAIAGVNGLM